MELPARLEELAGASTQLFTDTPHPGPLPRGPPQAAAKSYKFAQKTVPRIASALGVVTALDQPCRYCHFRLCRSLRPRIAVRPVPLIKTGADPCGFQRSTATDCR